MAIFFKLILISILVLISLPILLVGFIVVGMGIAAIHENFEEKKSTKPKYYRKNIF